VSSKLNDLAVADFLLFDLNQDFTTTTFSDIQRIAPAHTLTLSSDGCVSRRYWSMPIDEPVYYKRNSDYVDHFKELLTLAVRDRTRARPRERSVGLHHVRERLASLRCDRMRFL